MTNNEKRSEPIRFKSAFLLLCQKELFCSILSNKFTKINTSMYFQGGKFLRFNSKGSKTDIGCQEVLGLLGSSG